MQGDRLPLIFSMHVCGNAFIPLEAQTSLRHIQEGTEVLLASAGDAIEPTLRAFAQASNLWTGQDRRCAFMMCCGMLQSHMPGMLDIRKFALPNQEEELKKAGKLQGGVLTPASAMGMLLIDRLNAAGMTFKIEGASHAVTSEE